MIKLKDILVEIDTKKFTVYHGTGKNFRRFDLKKTTQGIIWFTSDKDKILKGEVGAESSGNILTCEISIKNPVGWDEYDKYSLSELEGMGYDGGILSDNGGFDYFVFDPKQVKILKSEKVLSVLDEGDDYRGVHKSPGKGNGVPLYDLTQIYPDDIYSSSAARYYGDMGGDANDKESIRLMQSYKGKPNTNVTIYRAVPTIDKEKDNLEINIGDWVTLNKNYAIRHGESALHGKYKIVNKTVPVRTLYTDANSVHEYGYDPS